MNFDNEESATKAFTVMGVGTQIKVSYYQAQHNLIPRADKIADQGVKNNTHYRVLYLTKLNKRVSDRKSKIKKRSKTIDTFWSVTQFI